MTAPDLDYKVELDVFEGPLDLLLHLVKKHELDILDIPIAFITEKYLEYLDLMTALSLDVAGEYLLMAATLAHIKSRELLPAGPAKDDDPDSDGDEEDIDPRQDLIRRLLEYQKYKEAAMGLGERPVVGRNVWTRGLPREDALSDSVDLDVMAPLAEFPVIMLIEALDRVLKRARIKLAHDVLVERLSLSERINQLASRLENEGSFSFTSCFRFASQEAMDGPIEMSEEAVREEIVVTFLALLEMAKLGIIGLSQPEGEEDIYIARATENVRERIAETVAGDDYR